MKNFFKIVFVLLFFPISCSGAIKKEHYNEKIKKCNDLLTLLYEDNTVNNDQKIKKLEFFFFLWDSFDCENILKWREK